MKLVVIFVVCFAALVAAQTPEKTPNGNANGTTKQTSSNKQKSKSDKSNSSVDKSKSSEDKSKSSNDQQKPKSSDDGNGTSDSEMNFSDFKQKFNKTYSSKQEEQNAQKIFNEKKAKIAKHNSNPNNTYRQGINSMSDISDEELQRTRTGFNGDNITAPTEESEGAFNKKIAKRAVVPEVNLKNAPINHDLRR
jgi:hypothetical protein